MNSVQQADVHMLVDKKSYIHQTMLDILDDFLSLHKDNNFFFWYFMNQLSHGNPFNLGRTDQDYYRFFKKHFDAGRHCVNREITFFILFLLYIKCILCPY